MVAWMVHGFAQEGTSSKKTWIKAGFVRPTMGGGTDGELGGTIYYAVYQLIPGKEKTEDPYGTGLGELVSKFMPGKGSSKLNADGSLPKYLYLYQLVNDEGIARHTKGDVTFAVADEVKARSIGSLVMRLPMDSKAIKSWGYFKEIGFTLEVADRDSKGEARLVANLPQYQQLGVSANPSIIKRLNELNGAKQDKKAKPIEFDPSSSFTLDQAGKNLTKSYFAEELTKKTKLVAWESDAKDSAKNGGSAPDSVEITNGLLKAEFAALKPGQHSIVIGLTSNLAPAMEAAALVDPKAAKKVDAIRPVGLEDIDFGAIGKLPLPKAQTEPVVQAPKTPSPEVGLQGGQKPANLLVGGLTLPADLPSSMLVDKGSYKAFGSTVYFAVFRRATTNTSGDTWGVGRNDMDGLFVPGESYRLSVSPTLDTTAEYLYLYQVVNDRAFHDLKLPANQKAQIATVALEGERPSPVREVASFALFLRSDPRLITSWGFFDDAGFNISVPNVPLERPVALDEKFPSIRMSTSANLSILDTLFPSGNKTYKPWAPALPLDFAKTQFDVGKDTTNIDKNTRIVFVANDETPVLQSLATKKLAKVKQTGANRPDFAQIIYFDRPVTGDPLLGPGMARPAELNIDGITLGPTDVARAIFKVEWLNRPIESGEMSVVFGFTSNVEPTRAPIRLKDKAATLGTSSDIQERVFLSPDRIKSIAVAQANAQGVATGAGTGRATGIRSVSLNEDADAVALAVASGQASGIVPVGLATAAAGSIGNGIGLAAAIPTPGEGGVGAAAGAGIMGFPGVAGFSGPGGGLGFGGAPGVAGGLGAARPGIGGGGGTGGGQGGGQGTGNGNGNGNSNGTLTGQGTITNTIGIDVGLNNTNQQQQGQFQLQQQQQQQQQQQNQRNNNRNNNHNCCCDHGNVVPAPPSLMLGLLGLPALLLGFRRRPE
jgi:hypothetical protein